MGLASLIGEQGTGKTTVLENLRDSLETTQIHCAFLRDPRLSTNRFFQTIASELDLRCQGTSAYQVFSALHQFTLQQARKGRTVALIVDDAHNLPADVLNEILHLASLHDDKVKLLQTVLAGRPELHNTLDALNLERLKQHAILGCTLEPFTAQETQYYVEFRLAQAGMPEQTIFPRRSDRGNLRTVPGLCARDQRDLRRTVVGCVCGPIQSLCGNSRSGLQENARKSLRLSRLPQPWWRSPGSVFPVWLRIEPEPAAANHTRCC